LLSPDSKSDSEASKLAQLLKDLASVSDEIYLDYVGLFDLWANATGSRGPHPILDDFYSAYTASFLEPAIEASRAWNRYIACCSRAFDPTTKIIGLPADAEPGAAFTDFLQKHEELEEGVDAAYAGWARDGKRLGDEIEGRLWMPQGLGWLVRVESVLLPWSGDAWRLTMRAELPARMRRARGHLDAIRRLFKDLREVAVQIESAGASDFVHESTRHTARAGRLMNQYLMLLAKYKFTINLAAGRTLETGKGSTWY
jgi:hypothetical protein